MALLARIGTLRPGLKVLNHYGPTETTVGVLTAELAAGEVTHLGSPLRNSRVQVLDATLQAVPGMAKGELCIAGAGLARGYLARPGLTAERFVPDAHGEPGARLYRTGDVVQRDRQGRLLYLGRVDHQLKIRGYRVEPGRSRRACKACRMWTRRWCVPPARMAVCSCWPTWWRRGCWPASVMPRRHRRPCSKR